MVVNPNLKPTVTCGTSTQNSVIFNWNKIAGATGYTVTYKINDIVSSGNGTLDTSDASIVKYTVTGLTAGDNVKIIVTPTGTGCFTPSTEGVGCQAQSCVDPTITWVNTSGNPTTQVVCENKPIVNIVYQLTGDATGVNITTGSLPTGISGNFNPTTKTYTISGTPNVGISGEFSFELTTVSCGTNQKVNGKITVTKTPDIPVVTIKQNTTCTKKGEIEVQVPSSTSALIISEVTDANSGTLSYVELFNKSSSSVDLSQYKLKRFPLKATCPDTTLSGTLASNTTYVIAIGTNADILAGGITANLNVANNNCSINTDDHFILLN